MAGGLVVKELASAAGTPAAGYSTLYPKSDNLWYVKTEGGLEVRVNKVKGADVASAATIDLDAATGDLVDVTGTTTITAITLSEGKECIVRFTGALLLTHGASLVLINGGLNIATAVGDYSVFRGYADGVVRQIDFNRASGQPLQSGIPIVVLNAQTGAYTLVAGDSGKLITCTGTFTLSVTAAATLGAGWWCWIKNASTGTITIDPDGTETISIPGGPETPGTTITLPYSGSTSGPYNVSGILLWCDGSNFEVISTLETHGKEIFTADGTWTCPAGVTKAWITGIGGGGGGEEGTTDTISGGGGGSGAIARATLVTPTPGTAYTVTIGTAGAAGTSGSGANGASGGTTSVGALLSLAGGAGGGVTAVGIGGTAGAGGVDGSNGQRAPAIDTQAEGGSGGLGGRGGYTSVVASAAQANSGGGGGGGGLTTANGLGTDGGAGGTGFVMVEW